MNLSNKNIGLSMDFEQLIANMTLETYQNLLKAVETKRWQDGTPLNAQQLEASIQATLAYQTMHLNNVEEPFTLNPQGEINLNEKQQQNNLVKDSANTIIQRKV